MEVVVGEAMMLLKPAKEDQNALEDCVGGIWVVRRAPPEAKREATSLALFEECCGTIAMQSTSDSLVTTPNCLEGEGTHIASEGISEIASLELVAILQVYWILLPSRFMPSDAPSRGRWR